MSDKHIDVKIKVAAYERGYPKTKLSQFLNDTGFVDKNTFEEQLEALKKWIVENFAGSGGFTGGSIFGGEVTIRETAPIDKQVYCGNVTERLTATIRVRYSGGDVIDRIAS